MFSFDKIHKLTETSAPQQQLLHMYVGNCTGMSKNLAAMLSELLSFTEHYMVHKQNRR